MTRQGFFNWEVNGEEVQVFVGRNSLFLRLSQRLTVEAYGRELVINGEEVEEIRDSDLIGHLYLYRVGDYFVLTYFSENQTVLELRPEPHAEPVFGVFATFSDDAVRLSCVGTLDPLLTLDR